jgi:hypothetical protein
LTSRRFQIFTAHDCDTETGADSTQTDDQTASQSNKRDVSHENSLKVKLKQMVKTKNKTAATTIFRIFNAGI